MRDRIIQYLDGQNFTQYEILPRCQWTRNRCDRTIVLLNPTVSDIDRAIDSVDDGGRIIIYI
jgi:hypothetical protein